MEEFKLDTAFVGVLKDTIRAYFRKCKSLTEEQKKEAYEELDSNHYDDRFQRIEFIEMATKYAVHTWREQNFKLAELWKQIAIENSKINNKPHETANQVIEEFKKQFNLE